MKQIILSVLLMTVVTGCGAAPSYRTPVLHPSQVDVRGSMAQRGVKCFAALWDNRHDFWCNNKEIQLWESAKRTGNWDGYEKDLFSGRLFSIHRHNGIDGSYGCPKTGWARLKYWCLTSADEDRRKHRTPHPWNRRSGAGHYCAPNCVVAKPGVERWP